MYIKLIQPKMKRRPMDTDLKIRMSPPLGLLTIASMCRDEHKVVIQNENIEKIEYDKPDVVGISITVDVLPRAVEIAKKFKQNGVVVVAGGIHITTSYQSVTEKCFDILCAGYAESTWPQILKDIKNQNYKRLYFCSKSFDGKDIVPPAYDLIDRKKYLYCNIIHTSRGCPFKCDFCYNSGKMHQYVNRKISDVIKEIKYLNRKHIMFIDDNLFGNRKWLLEFLKEIKPLEIKWNAAASINIAFETELLDYMKECGLQGLFIGFESINENSINEVHKVQNKISDYETAVKNLHSRGIMINASFVFGLDSDTKSTFKQTLNWIVKNKIETVTSHILTPYPGTVLYEKMKKENRITSNDLSLYNTAHVVFEPKNISSKDLYDGYIKIYKQIYSWKNILKRMPERKDQRAAYFMFNIFYRKLGRLTDFICRVISYEKVGIIAEKVSKYF